MQPNKDKEQHVSVSTHRSPISDIFIADHFNSDAIIQVKVIELTHLQHFNRYSSENEVRNFYVGCDQLLGE